MALPTPKALPRAQRLCRLLYSNRGNVLVPTHPIGNIPTLCQREISRQNCTTGNIPTEKKAVGIFPVEQQEMSRHNFCQQEMSRQQKNIVGIFPVAQQEISRQQKYCRDISCWPMGNVPTLFYPVRIEGVKLHEASRNSFLQEVSSHTIDQFWID
jgi:hypothetical protein